MTTTDDPQVWTDPNDMPRAGDRAARVAALVDQMTPRTTVRVQDHEFNDVDQPVGFALVRELAGITPPAKPVAARRATRAKARPKAEGSES